MSNTLVIKASKRQSFTDEDKREFLCKFFESGLSRSEFARKHGINPASITQWKGKYGKHVSKPETTLKALPAPEVDLQPILDENQKLKIEVKKLTDEIFQMQAFVGKKMFLAEMR